METTTKLFELLGANTATTFEKNKLKYKHIFAEDGAAYIHELANLYDGFRIEYRKFASTIDTFSLLAQSSEILDSLMTYFQDEVIFYKPHITEFEELQKIEKEQTDKYRKNHLHFLELIMLQEIKIARKVKNFIVEHRPVRSNDSEKSSSSLLERVRFEGNLSTLVTLFYTLQLNGKMSFNKVHSYPTDQKHLEAFLENNFSYKRGTTYPEVKNVDKALSDLRDPNTDTAANSKEKVLVIIDDTINSLTEFKLKIPDTRLRPIEKGGKK